MLWKRIVVGDQERVLLSKNGQFRGILTPGKYRIFVAPGSSLAIERHNVRDVVFQSKWADYLAEERPDLVERYFIRVETNEIQVGMVYVDDKLFRVMTPAKRMLFWRGAAKVTAELVNVIAEPEMTIEKLPWQGGHGYDEPKIFSVVDEAEARSLLARDERKRAKPAGAYRFRTVLMHRGAEALDR